MKESAPSKGTDAGQLPPNYKCPAQDMPAPPPYFAQSDTAYGYDQGPRTTSIDVQPETATAVIEDPATLTVTEAEPIPSMCDYIVVSCFVFWCCNLVFGAIAFVIAVMGTAARTPEEARNYGKISLWVNVAGATITVVVVIIVIVVHVT